MTNPPATSSQQSRVCPAKPLLRSAPPAIRRLDAGCAGGLRLELTKTKESSPMTAERIVSADSHVVEPADVWTARIDRRFAARAPHVVRNHGKLEGDFFVCENLPPTSVKGFALAGLDPKDYFKATRAGYAGV